MAKNDSPAVAKPKAKPAAPRRRPRLREQEEWPTVDLVLVERLERTFPQVSVKPGQSIEDAMFESGKAYVAALLREVYERQRRGDE